MYVLACTCAAKQPSRHIISAPDMVAAAMQNTAPAFAVHVGVAATSSLPLRRALTTQRFRFSVAKRALRAVAPQRSTPTCTQVLDNPQRTSKSNNQERKPRAEPHLASNGDSLQTTPGQVFLLTTHLALFSLVALRTLLAVEPSAAVWHILAVAFAYVFTDFAVGVYHHGVDNYGSENTPVLGFQIAAFQGHHVFPWTITARDTANNLYRLTKPIIPQMAVLLFFAVPTPFTSFYASFLFFIVASQETHRQAHMIRPAPWARVLQNAGLIVSQRGHAVHHRGSFDDSYCILSGHCNAPLDRFRFFRWVEALVYYLVAVEPHCWKLNSSLKKEALRKLSLLRLRL